MKPPTSQLTIPTVLDSSSAKNFRSLLNRYGGSIYIHASLGNTNVNSATNTLLKPSVDSVQGVNYEPSTGTFTIKTTGLYLVIGVVGWSAVTGIINTYVYKNGVQVNSTYANGLASVVTVDAMTLKGGDGIQFYAYQSSGTPTHVGVNPTYFILVKL